MARKSKKSKKTVESAPAVEVARPVETLTVRAAALTVKTRDRWGCALGTQAAAMNVALSTLCSAPGLTVRQIAEECGVSAARARSHLNWAAAHGIARNEGGRLLFST